MLLYVVLKVFIVSSQLQQNNILLEVLLHTTSWWGSCHSVVWKQVEASTSKGVIRIAGTAAGGILAYAVMLKPALATRSAPLAAILLCVTFLAGCAGQTQFKVNCKPLYLVCAVHSADFIRQLIQTITQ